MSGIPSHRVVRERWFEHETGEAGCRTMFFAVYVGPSMSPTLSEPDLMEVVPYDERPVRPGDVVFLPSATGEASIVHRVARVTPSGVFTRGDDNTREDVSPCRPEDVGGRVVAVWRGRRRSVIAGGFQGRLRGIWLRWRRNPASGTSRLLHPAYRALSRSGWLVRLLPAPARPRVVGFFARGRDRSLLLLGPHVVGRYDDGAGRWRIRRPFRLFVDERMLRRHEMRGRAGPGAP